MPWVGLEPTHPKAEHFECSASTYSATKAVVTHPQQGQIPYHYVTTLPKMLCLTRNQ